MKSLSIAVSIRVARNSRSVLPFFGTKTRRACASYGYVELINKTLEDEYWVMVLLLNGRCYGRMYTHVQQHQVYILNLVYSYVVCF